MFLARFGMSASPTRRDLGEETVEHGAKIFAVHGSHGTHGGAADRGVRFYCRAKEPRPQSVHPLQGRTRQGRCCSLCLVAYSAWKEFEGDAR